MKQLKRDDDTAMLVRGVDNYQHFKQDAPAETDLDPDALRKFEKLNQKYKEIVASNTITQS